jgi:hypothetical protein
MATEIAQAVAQATMLGGMQATMQGIERTGNETLQLIRAQQGEISKLQSSDSRQDTRLDGHDREFGEVRVLLGSISDKLDSKGLTWPKLLAGGAAVAAMLSVAIAAIVAVNNGLAQLAAIVESVAR